MAPGRIFVSYAGRDRAWAEWVAWQLADAGYPVEISVWDWSTGDNFVERMRDALAAADRVVALWSAAYFEPERFTTPEWTAVFAVRDGSAPRLVPVRVEDVTPPLLLRPLLCRDLFGLGEAAARAELLAAVGDAAGRPPAGPPFPVAAAAPRLPGTLPDVWNVPPRGAAFVGRDGMLVDLRERLDTGHPAVVQALHGMGGVGKSALAIEYAYRFAGGYDLVWWIDSEQSGLIGEQLAALGTAAGWVPADAATPTAVRTVHRRLRASTGWLVVFDNAGSPADLRQWLPQGAGHALITSRNPGWGELAVPVEVDVFARPESVRLLRSRVPALAEPAADRLAGQLGDLPLAVVQAAGVLAETGMSAERYGELLAGRTTTLLSEGVPASYPVSLAAAVGVAVDRLSAEDRAAAQILEVCAFLAPEPVPPSLFGDAPAGVLAEPLATVAGSPLDLHRCLGRIGRYGLARVTAAGPQLHRLTQAVLRDRLAPGERDAVRARAEAVLVAAHPDKPVDPALWPVWAVLVPHLFACDPAGTDNPHVRAFADRAISYLLARGDSHTALHLAEDVRAGWLEQFGPDHPVALNAAHTLARAYANLGRYAESRRLNEDTLARRQRVLGSRDPEAVNSAISLAYDLGELGELQAARELNEAVLALVRAEAGDDADVTLMVAGNLATDLFRLGDVAASRRLNEEILDVRRRTLGDEHPRTLHMASCLATDLSALGETAASRRLNEETLATQRRVLGEDHPDTLSTAGNLAVNLYRLGKVRAACELAADTLARRRRVLGEDHPDTVAATRNLAVYRRGLRRARNGRRR